MNNEICNCCFCKDKEGKYKNQYLKKLNVLKHKLAKINKERAYLKKESKKVRVFKDRATAVYSAIISVRKMFSENLKIEMKKEEECGSMYNELINSNIKDIQDKLEMVTHIEEEVLEALKKGDSLGLPMCASCHSDSLNESIPGGSTMLRCD